MYFANAPGNLYEAIDKNPSRFPPGALNILNSFINKELTLQNMNPEERRILQEAALEFFQTKPVEYKKNNIIKKEKSVFFDQPKQHTFKAEDEPPAAWWDSNLRLYLF